MKHVHAKHILLPGRGEETHVRKTSVAFIRKSIQVIRFLFQHDATHLQEQKYYCHLVFMLQNMELLSITVAKSYKVLLVQTSRQRSVRTYTNVQNVTMNTISTHTTPLLHMSGPHPCSQKHTMEFHTNTTLSHISLTF